MDVLIQIVFYSTWTTKVIFFEILQFKQKILRLQKLQQFLYVTRVGLVLPVEDIFRSFIVFLFIVSSLHKHLGTG